MLPKNRPFRDPRVVGDAAIGARRRVTRRADVGTGSTGTLDAVPVNVTGPPTQ